MSWPEYIVIVAILMQVVFTVQVIGNFRYALQKYKRPREGVRPRCVLIVPCKGIDSGFDRNIESFFRLNYKIYHLWFVVQDRSDPAYNCLLALKARHRQNSLAASVKILVSGQAQGCSQKLHNLLFAYRQIPADTEALVFADSDACAGPNWLSHIVYPLRQDKAGASGGYRCFVPTRNNAATLALASLNAKICELLGNTRFNLAWGGSMAILTRTFRDLKIDETWSKALSDDLSLSRAVRKAGLKMVFVPACMIASYESTTWPALWEFARRQFIITRVYAFGTWLFGLFSALLTVAGLWGGLALAIRAVSVDHRYKELYIALPLTFLLLQFVRALLRQTLIGTLLPKDKKRLATARRADLCLFWLWSLLMLAIIASSAVGRTITWRTIRYRLNSPTDIDVLK